MPKPDTSSRQIDELHGRIAELQTTLRLIEEQRERIIARRRRHVLIIGIGISLVVHLCLMYYLATQFRGLPGRGASQSVSYEFAILQDEELTEIEAVELDDLLPEVIHDADEIPENDPAADLDPAVPAADLQIARSGSLPTLGGAGEGAGAGGSLSGGGAGTSFFGVSSRGMRFAYIVDRSASMQGRKMQVAMRELARSVENLPDYAFFYVLLFSSPGFMEPPAQSGWTKAQAVPVNRFIRWLNTTDPGGGTEPMPAFHQVFSLSVRPDVIFFLTDGQIPRETADLVADLNRRGGKVVINTIAFGEPSSQDLLKQIAQESGGVYRFVPVEGR